jgi:CRP-like cAMP-binding protein
MTDSRFYAFQYQDLQACFETWPEIERLFRKISETVLIGMIDRVRELQSFSMEERFRAFAKRSPHLFQLIPHKYLASYLNISPTNFSKLYNRIKI